MYKEATINQTQGEKALLRVLGEAIVTELRNRAFLEWDVEGGILIEGDVVLDSDWHLPIEWQGAIVIVTGDVHLTGSYIDLGKPPNLRMLICGSLSCKHLLTSDFLFVGKDIRASHTFFGSSGHDCSFYVAGDIYAETFFLHDHHGEPLPSQPGRVHAHRTLSLGYPLDHATYDLAGESLVSALTEQARQALDENPWLRVFQKLILRDEHFLITKQSP